MARGRAGAIRIIGGSWRGTRIAVADSAALRPTPDRVRETLFNWLAPDLAGARCLDLFAGTGALGFEAVSRGAAMCDLVEQDAAVAANLEALRRRLSSERITVHRGDAVAWLERQPRPYDVVFVDPPFDSCLAPAVMTRLLQGWLSPTALVYLELPRHAPAMDDTWQTYRCGATREVSYALLQPSATASVSRRLET